MDKIHIFVRVDYALGMEMANGSDGFLAGMARVAARYLARRIGYSPINGVCGAALKNAAEGARSAIAPLRIKACDFRASLFGRYDDDESTLFADRMHAQGVANERSARLARNLGRSAVAMFFAAGGFLTLGTFQIAAASHGRQLLFGIATVFVALIFLVLGARKDFDRWQIKSRRFGAANNTSDKIAPHRQNPEGVAKR